MEVITYTVTPEEDGVCVRHILKAKLHFSTHAVARLTRAENGIRVNPLSHGAEPKKGYLTGYTLSGTSVGK